MPPRASGSGGGWAECSVDDNDCKGVPTFQRRGWRTYFVDGPLFFGSTQTFSGLFKPKSDPNDVVIDFMESRVMDHSALEAINSLAERYGALGKRVHRRCPDPPKPLARSKNTLLKEQ